MDDEIRIMEKSDYKEIGEMVIGQDIDTATELDLHEIQALSDLESLIAYLDKKKIPVPRLKKWVEKYKVLKVSYERKSRNELVKIMSSVMEEKREEPDEDTLRKLRGLP